MDYDLVVCVDAYAYVHLMMPTIFDDCDVWMNAAKTRNDVPVEIWGELSEERLRYDHAFIAHIRNQGFGFSSQAFLNFLTDNWQYDTGNFFSRMKYFDNV